MAALNMFSGVQVGLDHLWIAWYARFGNHAYFQIIIRLFYLYFYFFDWTNQLEIEGSILDSDCSIKLYGAWLKKLKLSKFKLTNKVKRQLTMLVRHAHPRGGVKRRISTYIVWPILRQHVCQSILTWYWLYMTDWVLTDMAIRNQWTKSVRESTETLWTETMQRAQLYNRSRKAFYWITRTGDCWGSCTLIIPADNNRAASTWRFSKKLQISFRSTC